MCSFHSLPNVCMYNATCLIPNLGGRILQAVEILHNFLAWQWQFLWQNMDHNFITQFSDTSGKKIHSSVGISILDKGPCEGAVLPWYRYHSARLHCVTWSTCNGYYRYEQITFITVIIIIMLHCKHGFPWPSFTSRLYRLSLPRGLPGFTLYRYIAYEFSSSVPHVWFV